MRYEDYSDEGLRDVLRDIDEGDKRVSRFAADFIENVVYTYSGPLSGPQRAKAIEIIREHN